MSVETSNFFPRIFFSAFKKNFTPITCTWVGKASWNNRVGNDVSAGTIARSNIEIDKNSSFRAAALAAPEIRFNRTARTSPWQARAAAVVHAPPPPHPEHAFEGENLKTLHRQRASFNLPLTASATGALLFLFLSTAISTSVGK